MNLINKFKFKNIKFDFKDNIGELILYYFKFKPSKKHIKYAKLKDLENYNESCFQLYIVYDKNNKIYKYGYMQYILNDGEVLELKQLNKSEIDYIKNNIL